MPSRRGAEYPLLVSRQSGRSREINPDDDAALKSSKCLEASVTNYLLTKWRCQMVKHIVRFMREEDGATAVEYGLMIALITAALVAIVTTLGTNLVTRFTTVSTAIGS
jgi:pilus assembly protein Flp/PilA